MPVTPAQPDLDFDDFIRDRTLRFSGRTWVFEFIDNWLVNPAASRYLLLTGEPGSGKSAVAARLAQFSRGTTGPPLSCRNLGRQFLSAMHFCSASAGAWINPLSFARS